MEGSEMLREDVIRGEILTRATCGGDHCYGNPGLLVQRSPTHLLDEERFWV